MGPRTGVDVVIKIKIRVPGRNRSRFKPVAQCRCLKHAAGRFILYGPIINLASVVEYVWLVRFRRLF